MVIGPYHFLPKASMISAAASKPGSSAVEAMKISLRSRCARISFPLLLQLFPPPCAWSCTGIGIYEGMRLVWHMPALVQANTRTLPSALQHLLTKQMQLRR